MTLTAPDPGPRFEATEWKYTIDGQVYGVVRVAPAAGYSWSVRDDTRVFGPAHPRFGTNGNRVGGHVNTIREAVETVTAYADALAACYRAQADAARTAREQVEGITRRVG